MKRSTFAFALFAAVFALVAFTSAAQAQTVEQIGKYYSDDTYTTQVGGKIYDCCGGVVTWGYYTQYQIWETAPCGECFPHDPCNGEPTCCDDPVYGAGCSAAVNETQEKLRAVARRFNLPEGTVLRLERVKPAKACILNGATK